MSDEQQFPLELIQAINRLTLTLTQIRDRLESWDTTYLKSATADQAAKTIHSLRMTATIFDQTRR